jgi:hypothetical protein
MGKVINRMREKLTNAFAEMLNRVAALSTRMPSTPVLVDGSPWTGDWLGDVAIVMSANGNVIRQHLRIARALVEIGLETVFVYTDLRGPDTPNPELYDVPGVRVVKLPLRSKRGGLHSENPLVQLSMWAELNALFTSRPFKAIVTHIDQWGFFGLLVYWAKTMGIPSVVVQEGITAVYNEPTESDEHSKTKRGLRALAGSLIHSLPHPLLQTRSHYAVADFFCAYGEAGMRKSVGQGRDSATVFVVGNPSFDHVTELPAQRTVHGENRTVLYAEQHIVEPEKELAFFDQLARICCDQNGDRLIVKLHPWAPWRSEDVERATSTSDKRASLLTVTKLGDSADMLDDVDLLLTIHSTTAYHAFVKGIPVITVNYLTDGRAELDAYRYGGAIDVRNENDLEKAIHDATRDEEVRRRLHEGAIRVISDHLYRLDGQASRRIAQVVLDVSLGHPAAPKSVEDL